jgi:rhodanese-related sulfurtransferase
MHAYSENLSRLASAARTFIDEVSASQARLLVKQGALWLDVREGDDLRAGVGMPGAVHLPRSLWGPPACVLLPDRRHVLVAYCADGDRGALAALSLGQQGYMRVFNVSGGLQALQRSGD